jgi:selenocysteine-specific elongation factor
VVGHFVIGTAGHIDHGKSTLVCALTGTDPDRLKEEKARGITIDLGFAHYVEDGISFSFVDVPGHERFVKNMLAGVTGIDAVLLVVAADESVMPQTREHFDICRLLRVRSGLVVLTKADLVDEETRQLVRLEVRDLVAGSFLEPAPVLPVSARTGQGLDELRLALRRLADTRPARRSEGTFRLPIDRVFSMKGFGTVVTGTVVSGRLELSRDPELEVAPHGLFAKVRGLQVHGEAAAVASAGQRAAVNLGGVEVGEMVRGDTLLTPGGLRGTRRIDALLDVLPGARPLRHGARLRVHQGTSEILGRVAVSQVIVSPSGGPAGPAEIPPGGRAHVRIRLEAPAVVTRGDRFVARAYSPPVTIAGGVVLDPMPPRGATRGAAQLERFARLDPGAEGFGDPSVADRALAVLVDEGGLLGVPVDELTWRLGLGPADAEAAVARAEATGGLVRVGEVLASRARLDAVGSRLVAQLEAFHRREPLADGVPREELRERLFGRGRPLLFDHLVAELARRGIVNARDRLAMASHRVAVHGEEAAVLARLERAFGEGGLTPPDPASLATLVHADRPMVDRLVQLLVRQRTLVRLDTLLFHAAALERLKNEVRALKTGAGTAKVDVAAFKERYGITRKFAIPLLEYLDRERVTRRAGDTRIVL